MHNVVLISPLLMKCMDKRLYSQEDLNKKECNFSLKF